MPPDVCPFMELRRVYDARQSPKERRILVDRLWPRGLSKEAADLDEWAKDLAPSHELRKAFHAGAIDFEQLEGAYRQELQGANLQRLGRDVTLLTAAKDPHRSHLHILAAVLAETLEDEESQ